MRYLLDTNVVSNLRKLKPHSGLVAWLASVPRDAVFMSAPTVSEIQCGIGQTREPAIAAAVDHWLSNMLHIGYPPVVPFDADAARYFGRMWATPSLDNFIRNDPRGKKRKSGADLAVTACAIAQGMAIVTEDNDYLQIHAAFPLPGLFSPFKGTWHVAPGD